MVLEKNSVIAVDIGNTSTLFGLFVKGRLVKRHRVLTEALKSLNAKVFKSWGSTGKVSILISSVVPGADQEIKRIFKVFGSRATVRFISAKNISHLVVRANKEEVGADRVVNAYAAWKLYGKELPLIIVDFGTATTFCAVNGNGEYLGGAIAPGIKISAAALHEKTAKLPLVDLKKPIKKVIGSTTKEAMESGLYLGYVAMVEGMVNRFKNALGGKAKVIGTGGYAPLIWRGTRVIDIIDPDLTLKGLALIGENND